MDTVGENTTAVSASLEPEGGFLLYRAIVLDNNSYIHMLLIDPAYGNRLLNRNFHHKSWEGWRVVCL
jgi:hypothetical protein